MSDSIGQGRVEAIYLFPDKGSPPLEVPEAIAVSGQGLEGDHKRSRKAQISVLAVEAWEDATRELGATLSPATRRANLLISGIDLKPVLGLTLRLGEIRIRVHDEAAPCIVMERACPGLKDALTPELRGGVYGPLLNGGRVAVGDPVFVEAAQPDDGLEPASTGPSQLDLLSPLRS